MKMEYVIPRKKSKTIGYFIGMIFCLLLFLTFIIFDINSGIFENKVFMYIFKFLCLVCIPVLIYAAIFYFKQIFNKDPVLVVDETGVLENFNPKKCVGKIFWEDIESFIVRPYMGNTCFIYLYLYNPEKYINNPKLLKRIKNRKRKKSFGDVQINSLYFKKETDDIIYLIDYYIKLSRI